MSAGKWPAVASKERIKIKNRDGETLVGELDNVGSAEVIILCHGFQSSKEDKTLVNLASTLTNEGFSNFRFDFSGNGESEGQFLYGNYWKEVEDLRAVVSYFREKRMEVNTLIGHSKGGNAVLLYASKYQDIDAVINISARFALHIGMEGRLGKGFMNKINQHGFIDVKDKSGRLLYRVTKKSLLDRLQTDMKSASLLIPTSSRVLTIHGTKDEMVPVQDAFEFDKLISNHSLCIIEQADHNYTHHQKEVANIVLNFVRIKHKTKHESFHPTKQCSSRL